MKLQNQNGKINAYQSPIFEVLEIQVESGFATSGENECYESEDGTWE